MKLLTEIKQFIRYILDYRKYKSASTFSILRIEETSKKPLLIQSIYDIQPQILLNYQGNVDDLKRYVCQKMMIEIVEKLKKNDVIETICEKQLNGGERIICKLYVVK